MIQYLITAIIDIAVGILALSKKNNPAAKALAFTAIGLGVWSLELYFLTIIDDISLLNPIFHVTRWGMFFIPSTFALLTWRLVGSRSGWFKHYFVMPGLAVSAGLSVINTFILPSELHVASGGYLPVPDVIYYIFFISFLWGFVGSLIMVATSFRASSFREKQRLKWLLITLFVTFVFGTIVIISMPFSDYLSKFIGPITNITFVSLLFYSTIQHNLMDFRLALSVGLARLSVLGFFIWLYFVFTAIIGDQVGSTGGALVLLAFIVLLLEAYPRLLRWILPNAKKMLTKNSYEFDDVKDDTEKALHHTMSVPMLMDVLNHLLFKIVRINTYKILIVKSDLDIKEKKQEIDFSNYKTFNFISESDPLVAYAITQKNLIMEDEMPDNLRVKMSHYDAISCFSVYEDKKLLAVVLLGASSDLAYYRYDDIKIFEWLANELGQVLQRLIRLEQMQNQLGEARKTLSMLGMMSHYHHDIKAPFAIIDGVLSNDFYDRDKQKLIVLEQVERGSRLIATMASILGGNRKRRVQPCAVEALLKDCLFVFETAIDHVEYDIPAVPHIMGDAEDLKILFINIIKNASEARRGREDLSLKVKAWVDANAVYFSIKDDGMGMSEQQLADLWGNSYSDKALGSGIGLQAIKRIADEHSAKIDVNSEVGKGTEFIISFPASLFVDNSAGIASNVGSLVAKDSQYGHEHKAH